MAAMHERAVQRSHRQWLVLPRSVEVDLRGVALERLLPLIGLGVLGVHNRELALAEQRLLGPNPHAVIAMWATSCVCVVVVVVVVVVVR